MKILLTNDDGIDAPGLRTLEQAAMRYGDILVVAPDRQYSGCGHQLTFNRPIHVTQRDPKHYVVEGSPADCVRLAVTNLSDRIDWVISGINEGANLGLDVFLSGTVAAAREATWLGVSAIALSQYHRGAPCEGLWDGSLKMAAAILEELFSRPLEPAKFWNVNFPDRRVSNGHVNNGHPKLQFIQCPLDPNPVPIQYHRDENRYHFSGDYHSRPRSVDHDVDVCFKGHIALTLV